VDRTFEYISSNSADLCEDLFLIIDAIMTTIKLGTFRH
jgi:hypothetical protein